jgi:hypothetical protein
MFHVHSDEFTSTSKSDQCFVLFSMQMALYESILASPHRTLNGEEADYFYVPVLDSCLITRSDDAPHLLMPRDLRLRSYHALEYYRMAYDHITQQYPYWNRTSGRDHIWAVLFMG